MNILQIAMERAAGEAESSRLTALVCAEWRRTTANRIARLCRRMGFADARAAQQDDANGTRDVHLTIEGERVLIGCLSGIGEHIAILAPNCYYCGIQRARIEINSSLKSLPYMLLSIATRVFERTI